MTGGSGHRPVLVDAVLEGLAVSSDGWYVDGTYGRGGHSSEILARLGVEGRLLALDKDPAAVADGVQRFGADARFTIVHAGFERLAEAARPWLGARRLDGLLLDLGVSSPQLDTAERGFGFAKEGPLDMRFDTTRGVNAAQWLNEAGEAELRDAFKRYGEEPKARAVAAAIVKRRARAPLATTRELAELVAAAVGARARTARGGTHPATRVFQAVRIAVNDELAALEHALAQSLDLLARGGRLAVISFHSLEDRIVKRFIARCARGNPAYAGLPSAHVPPAERPTMTRVGRLVRASAAEVAANPRARSARLRVAARLDPAGTA